MTITEIIFKLLLLVTESWAVYQLWNTVMPVITNAGTCSLAQAAALLLLVRILIQGIQIRIRIPKIEEKEDSQDDKN